MKIKPEHLAHMPKSRIIYTGPWRSLISKSGQKSSIHIGQGSFPSRFQPVRVPKLPAIPTGFGALTNVSGDTMRKPIDIAGQVFGRLTVLHRSGSYPDGQAG